MNISRILRIVLMVLGGLVVAAVIARWQLQSADRMAAGPAAAVGGPFQLVDHTGRTVTDADYRGKQLLIYFGYTFCPDVCPTELAAMAQALDRLGPAADKVQPLFITIDPARDTVEKLAQYVPLFHPRMAGLTGTAEQIATVAKAYRVYYAKAPAKAGEGKAGDDATYMMDHSSFVYWMDGQNRFRGVFPAGTSAGEMAEKLRAGVAG